MIPNFEIKHDAVREYHDYLVRVYRNETIPKNHRYEVAKRIEVIQDLVEIYEQGQTSNFEELSWTEMGNPLLPEDHRKLAKGIKEYIKESRSNQNLMVKE